MTERDLEAILARLDSIESLLRHVLAELQGQRPVVDAHVNQRALWAVKP